MRYHSLVHLQVEPYEISFSRTPAGGGGGGEGVGEGVGEGGGERREG